MKIIHLLIIALILGACNEPGTKIPDEVPYHRDPETPSKEVLDAASTVRTLDLKEERIDTGTGHKRSYFYLNEKLFTGWSYQVFDDTEHKYRYLKCEEGVKVWQIGYYEDGTIDHDFHMKAGKGLGSERMWMADGNPYTDYYYSSSEKMDGVQRRWFTNNTLARDGLYKDGELIYDIFYNQDGTISEYKGVLPEHLKKE
jgi:hypothetical protein